MATNISPPRTLHRRGVSFRIGLWVFAFFWFAWVCLEMLSRYEAIVAPVIADFRVTEVRPTSGSIVLSGELDKRRDCALLRTSVHTGDRDDPEAPRERLFAKLVGPSQNDDEGSLPTGSQSWGPYEIERPRQVWGPDIFVRMTHSCHPLITTRGTYFIAEARPILGDQR